MSQMVSRDRKTVLSEKVALSQRAHWRASGAHPAGHGNAAMVTPADHVRTLVQPVEQRGADICI